jgi:hypothetical protein
MNIFAEKLIVREPVLLIFVELLIADKDGLDFLAVCFLDGSDHYAESNFPRPVVALPKTPCGEEAIKAARPTLRIFSRSVEAEESSVTEGVGGGGGGAEEDFLFPPNKKPMRNSFRPIRGHAGILHGVVRRSQGKTLQIFKPLPDSASFA